MRVLLVAVGRLRGELEPPIRDYERRIGRYYKFEALEVAEEPARSAAHQQRVLEEEGKRLLARVPADFEIVALHREGDSWSSERLARFLAEHGLRSSPGVAFLIGGAFGLSDEVLSRAAHRLSLSAFTMPHELARLVLAEQLYRAGTISRGEPYHKTVPRGGKNR